MSNNNTSDSEKSEEVASLETKPVEETDGATNGPREASSYMSPHGKPSVTSSHSHSRSYAELVTGSLVSSKLTSYEVISIPPSTDGKAVALPGKRRENFPSHPAAARQPNSEAAASGGEHALNIHRLQLQSRADPNVLLESDLFTLSGADQGHSTASNAPTAAGRLASTRNCSPSDHDPPHVQLKHGRSSPSHPTAFNAADARNSVVCTLSYDLSTSNLTTLRKGKAVKIVKKQELQLKARNNPSLTLSLAKDRSNRVVLNCGIHVPSGYSRILDAARFGITVALTETSSGASAGYTTSGQLLDPQHKTFTLVQEDKTVTFDLLSHLEVEHLVSSRATVHLNIEVTAAYDEGRQVNYEAREHELEGSESYVEIQLKPNPRVLAEKTVSVSQKEERVDWTEHGVILHVSDASTNSTTPHHVTVLILQSDVKKEKIIAFRACSSEDVEQLTLRVEHTASASTGTGTPRTPSTALPLPGVRGNTKHSSKESHSKEKVP